MVEIPDYLLTRKPVLISKTKLASARYKKNIDEIIEWLIEVDDYTFSKEFDELQTRSLDSDNLLELEKYLRGHEEVTDPEILLIYYKCLKFRPGLKIKELLKFLGLASGRKRGRPQGKKEKTQMLDIGVHYYRRLHKILKAEYGIEAREALLEKISSDWVLDKNLLLQHLKRPLSRVAQHSY